MLLSYTRDEFSLYQIEMILVQATHNPGILNTDNRHKSIHPRVYSLWSHKTQNHTLLNKEEKINEISLLIHSLCT